MKTLCKLKKDDLALSIQKIIKITQKPKYICTKCARVAKDKEYLCHAMKMKKNKE